MELEVSFAMREELVGAVVLAGIVEFAEIWVCVTTVSLAVAVGVVVLILPVISLVVWVVAAVAVVGAGVVITAGRVVLVPVIPVLT